MDALQHTQHTRHSFPASEHPRSMIAAKREMRGIHVEPRPLIAGQPYHEGELLVLRDALGTLLGLRRVTACREATAADECGRKVEWIIKTQPVILNSEAA